MAQRTVRLALTGLYLLILPVWANVEVSMEDRVQVYLNDVAEIPCIYSMDGSSSSPTVQWFIKSASDSMVRIEEQGTGFSGRISVSNSMDGMTGNSVLNISAVRVSDERDFICQVNVDGDTAVGRTRLLVFNNPSIPSIEAGKFASVTEILDKIASCDVSNGHPQPKISWYKDRAPLHHSDHVQVKNTVTVTPNGLYSVHSDLYVTVVKEDKDAYFYCAVTYPVPGAEKMIESERINITVHYPTTEVTVFQVSPNGLVKEGDSVEIRCEGDGNPQPIKSFMHNNELIQEEDMLLLSNVTRLNSGLYECSSLDTTTYANIEGNLTLLVHYLDPVVITPEKPDSLDQGEDLSLTCNALSSLSTHASWYKDDLLLHEGHVLTLYNVSFTTAGTYVCEVGVPELPELKRHGTVQVRVRGKPMMTDELALIPLDTGNAINVSCRVSGHPTPTIHWSLSDEQAALGRWDTRTDNSIESIISISTSSEIKASCIATNDLGRAETSRQIQARGNGYIIAVIIILILLLAILGSVLYFMYKKGKISCGRSGKQDLTKEKASSDDIVVEMKNSKSEEAVLLQGVNGDRKTSRD